VIAAPPEFEDVAGRAARLDRGVRTLTSRSSMPTAVGEREWAELQLITPIEACSPLEAIMELDESRLHPCAVVIADAQLDQQSHALRVFLRDAYPSIKTIIVGRRHRSVRPHAAASTRSRIRVVPP
jgi:hypothetical protein